MRFSVSDVRFPLLILAALPAAAAATYAATAMPAQLAVPANVDQSFITGVLSIFGIGVVVVFGLCWAVLKVFDARFAERMTIYMADDTLPFGRHRADPDAHSKLKEKIEASFKVELKQLHDDNQAMEDRHHATMQALMSIMKPIVDQNAEAMKIMRANMRRQPGDAD